MSEHHSKEKDYGLILSDFILGFQDGLVNVLGIVLGVAVGTQSTPIVLLAGLAATFAESISMAAVGYTSKKAETDFYEKQKEIELREMRLIPKREKKEVEEIFRKKGFKGKDLKSLVRIITSNKKAWLNIMMTEELNLTAVQAKNPLKSGALIGVSAFIGSFVPLTPFFFLSIENAFTSSVIFSGIILFSLGAVKGKITQRNLIKSGLEILLIAGLAAMAGYLVGAYFGLNGI